MSDAIQIKEAIDHILTVIGRAPLRALLFEPLEVEDYEAYLARLSYRVPLSYLPFAIDDSGILVMYLHPEQKEFDAPILILSNNPIFCAKLRSKWHTVFPMLGLCLKSYGPT